jgi:alkylation response protein AidB-like acyl-CoA dehydrogenase
MAKLMASRACNKAARAVIRVIGLEGTTRAHATERLLRDARITEIYEGVTDIQKLVIARGLFAE